MEHRTAVILLLLAAVVAALPAPSHGWGVDGHLIVCQIAQGRLSDAATKAVNDLLPSDASDNLSSLCSWADKVRFRYHWSAPLHFIDTPDNLCTYNYDNNLTEALLFLSHFMGDVHQPLHVGFSSDRGGNTIDVHWYRRKTVLHHVWDVNIIETAEKDYYDEGTAEFVDALNKNITMTISIAGWPVVNLRLAQGGVRLAATLNRIFGQKAK
ncbi:hypothetical protein ACQ4PT_063655 [Festuca glaucescens]